MSDFRFSFRVLLGLLLFFVVAASHSLLPAAESASPVAESAQAPEEPVAEHYFYDISFLWFDRIAEAELSLQPEGNAQHWQAILDANTLGVAAWLTSDRAQHYSSTMQLDNDGSFTVLRHDTNIIKTKDGRRRVRLKRYLFDHDRERIVLQVNRNGRQKDDVILPMPAVKPNDILAAFYNFRRGLYGPVIPGSRCRIPTYTSKGQSEILVDVLGAKQRPRRPEFPDGGLLLKVQLAKEIFDTSDGIVYVWLDPQGRPARVVVQDVIGLGDVRCTLRQKGQRS